MYFKIHRSNRWYSLGIRNIQSRAKCIRFSCFVSLSLAYFCTFTVLLYSSHGAWNRVDNFVKKCHYFIRALLSVYSRLPNTLTSLHASTKHGGAHKSYYGQQWSLNRSWADPNWAQAQPRTAPMRPDRGTSLILTTFRFAETRPDRSHCHCSCTRRVGNSIYWRASITKPSETPPPADCLWWGMTFKSFRKRS